MRDEGDTSGTEVSDSQGTMIGGGNTQINNWSPRTPLTPTALAALSPHAAVARIRAASHDEAVDLFASAPTEILSKKLKALLLADEARVVAILADLDPDRVSELVKPVRDDFRWLAGLAMAAEAIAHRAVSLRWDHDPGAGWLERAATSPQKTNGYFRQYRQGRIYCVVSFPLNALEVSGAVAEFHLASGGTGGNLGFPVRAPAISDQAGRTGGIWQKFEGAHVAASKYGTYRVSPRVFSLIGVRSGFPVAQAEKRDGGLEVQRFETVAVYSSEAGTTFVRLEVAEHAGDPWIPITDEEEAGSYRVQFFKNFLSMRMAVYSSDYAGAVPVVGRMLAFYQELGGPGSWLGLPVEKYTAAINRFNGRLIQRFERGSVYERLGHDVVAVPAETVDLVGDRLGWPTSNEEAVGGDDGHRIQYFEHGLVTLDGGREIWRREPPPLTNPPDSPA
jgi:hypothetical protein